jgi:TRAP-type C4-dicarboxylate transport system substrate-binding protein
MNKEAWEKLTPGQQKAVEESANKVMEKQFIDAKKEDQKYIDLAIKSGMKYLELSDDEIREMAKIVREKVWPLLEPDYGPEIMEAMRKNAPKL